MDWLTSAMPWLCSAVAAVTSPMMSDTRCTLATISPMVVPASRTRRAPAPTRSTLVAISALISRAASALRWASERTSPATTAKPRPCAPARAASTAALSARMLVWKAMLSITPMMSPILRELALISSMVVTTLWTICPPCRATVAAELANWLACVAESALCRTVPVSCCMLDDVCSSCAACRSVRTDRSWLPAAISREATVMESVPLRTLATMEARPWAVSRTAASRLASAPRATWMVCDRSPSDICRITSRA